MKVSVMAPAMWPSNRSESELWPVAMPMVINAFQQQEPLFWSMGFGPKSLVRAAQIDGASFFQIFWRILLPSSGPIIVVSVIWQFTNIWNDFLFGASFSGANSTPMTVALNNLVSSSTGVKEYNVHFAAAILAALPTLIVYIVSGRYFVRGLMSGAVKG